MRTALLLAPASFLDSTSRWLDEHGIQQAIAEHHTPALYDWMVPLLAFQGIGDTAAVHFDARHAPVAWHLVDDGMRAASSCPRLRSHWHFYGCGYRKARFACAEPDRIADCFLPLLPLRKGSLNQAAASLYLFLRDVCHGDLVGWIDDRLAAADPGQLAPHRGRTMAASVIEPLCHVVGRFSARTSICANVSPSLLGLTPSDRERHRTASRSQSNSRTSMHAPLAHKVKVPARRPCRARAGADAMNDNEPLGDYGIPKWACEIVDKHDLGLRADNPLAAARVLLTDAGDLVQEIVTTAFREQALTPSIRQRLRKALVMLTDAESLSAICADEPSPGTVTTLADGTQAWEPAPS